MSDLVAVKRRQVVVVLLVLVDRLVGHWLAVCVAVWLVDQLELLVVMVVWVAVFAVLLVLPMRQNQVCQAHNSARGLTCKYLNTWVRLTTS